MPWPRGLPCSPTCDQLPPVATPWLHTRNRWRKQELCGSLSGPFSVGGAKIEPTDAIDERDPRGQEDDRDLAHLLTTYESFGHLPAGQPRQIDIEQVTSGRSSFASATPVGPSTASMTPSKVDAHEQPNRRFVIDVQDPDHRSFTTRGGNEVSPYL